MMSPCSETWRLATVSPDETHHIIDGRPFYEARYVQVLKYHPPGLAPARDASGMVHIDGQGRPVYASRYRRTFGFYEGLAAVEGQDGWFHVDPAGRPTSPRRWSWCGNFQEGRCPVRDVEGSYLHIDTSGEPVTGARWRYAGDYRDGVAVVQGDDGRSTHVDREGQVIHDTWFQDLDVYHKGYARARDDAGWTHVNRLGEPAYARRFAAVEPFYNGQARVEGLDGSREVVDEEGRTLAILRSPRVSDLQAVSADLVSYWRCESAFAAVRCQILEQLPLLHGDLSLARARLLGALGEMGWVELQEGRWSLTPKGHLLRRDHPDSLGPAARFWAEEGRAAWSRLDDALQEPGWHPPDPFAAASMSPEEVARLQDALVPYARHDYGGFARCLDPGHRRLIDAGGGSGALALGVVSDLPALEAVVLDRPEVAVRGRVPPGCEDRLSFQAGDLFSPWPVGGDAIVLARVLHDWGDVDALRILEQARAALDPDGRIYVVEMVRPERGSRGGLLSLHLLLTTGGQERTRSEFEDLFHLAGLRLRDLRSLAQVASVLVLEVQ